MQLSRENKIIVNEVIEELLIIKQNILSISKKIVTELKTWIVQFIMSYNEYSIRNIKKRGLTDILLERAMRFFGLSYSTGKEKQQKQGGRKFFNYKTIYKWSKRAVKLVLLPIVLLLFTLKEVLMYRNKNVKRNSLE